MPPPRKKRNHTTVCSNHVNKKIRVSDLPFQQIEDIDTNVGHSQVQYCDMLSAIEIGLNSTTRLPLGDESASKPIGASVKAFWDADNVWYDGRVLLYDPEKKLHLLYFEVDGTFEWMDISSDSEDAILLVDELVLHGKYPAKKYTGTDKGLSYVKKNSTGNCQLCYRDCFILCRNIC